MTLWDPQSLIQTNWTESTPTSGTSARIWPSCETSDHLDDGGIRFDITATLTGESWKAISPVAAQRMICLYLIWRLGEKDLKEACEVLIDIYNLREHQSVALDHPQREVRWNLVSGVDRVERVPFEFAED